MRSVALILFVLGIALLWAPHCALAQPRAFVLEGIEGVWWPLPEAQQILLLEHERQDLSRRVRLLDEALVLARREIDLGETVRTALSAELEGTRAANVRLQEALVVDWYESPVFWGVAGLLTGIALVTAIALGVQ